MRPKWDEIARIFSKNAVLKGFHQWAQKIQPILGSRPNF
jgi:hypothetical protein